ncbi:hypothetical protein PIB30_102711 [Stylosanthes scabra]|uniref:Putative plant transposon protein domain-containing protein n=1 Tax=Stylosanthes scabra TaxID=79078 RepID=A0ABU6VW70_9FABA|nr:hypothetical protein [Stylosanthes scabra]
MFEESVRSKDIISEKSFELKDEEYPEIRNQITLRGWKRLASPRTNVKVLMIKEFFANAARTQEEMDEAEQHPLKSFVTGVEVDFSPANIKRVMKFKDNTPGTETNYNTRQDSNQMLEEVLRDLCIPGATWKLGSGQPPQPIQLRRKELQPLARGWLEFVTHNIHPSSNRSEVTVAKAILIHSIIKGEDVRVEELISAGIANIAQNLKLKGKLGFPSLIYKLCKEAKVPFGEYKRNACVNEENTITAKGMETDFQQQQQQGFKAITDLITDMKLETLNYFENMKQNQENQFDQMKAIIAQQQEIIANQNREFQAMGQKQDQLEKELSEIRRAQVNLAMYKSSSSSQMTTTMVASSEEKLDQIASSIEAFREELKIFKGRNEELANFSYAQYSKTRKEQAALSKEIKEIREHPISPTTEHPTTPANNETLMDIARMTY